MNQDFLGSSKKWDWETPWGDFKKINAVFHFKLDAAATLENSKCDTCITPEQDAFKTEWTPTPWFLNPPWGVAYKKEYGITMMDWVRRINDQVMLGYDGVFLCSARVDTEWWHTATMLASYILFPRRRIKFVDPNRTKKSSPTFPSCYIIYWDKPLTDEQYKRLGKIGILVEVCGPLATAS